MVIRERSGRLRGGRRKTKEDVNPMNHIANLVDAMLVLAVGIMLALVMSWNLQISSAGKISVDEKKADVNRQEKISEFTEEDIKDIDEEDQVDVSGFEQKGNVYRDPKTGKYYITESGEAAGEEE